MDYWTLLEVGETLSAPEGSMSGSVQLEGYAERADMGTDLPEGATGMVVVRASAATAVAGAGVLCAPSPSFLLSSFPFLFYFFSSISNVYTLF